MATFLTTERMSPALKERVERAVSGRARAKHNAAKLGLSGTFAGKDRLRAARLVPAVTLLVVAGIASATYAHETKILEEERGALAATIEDHRAQLPEGYETFIDRVDPFLEETAAKEAPPDVIDPEMKEPGALDAWLGMPAVYVRGPAAELRDPHTRSGAVAGSDKDAFLYCLTSPPQKGDERDLVESVRGVYFAGAKVDEQTANIRRLHGARLGLSVLTTEVLAKVRAAEDALTLKKLHKDLEAAPVAEAKKAAGARLLIAVADEPGGRAARVTLADVTANKVLLRLQLPVKSSGLTPLAMLHRDELSACSLALSVRRAVEE